MIDRDGFRRGIAIVLINRDNKVFWARRIGKRRAWQFPQGGILENENFEDAMYRELHEETGLLPNSVEVLGSSRRLLTYHLPKRFMRRGSVPLCFGQKQQWFLLRLLDSDECVDFNVTDAPEFDRFRWVHYWVPVRRIIRFKRRVYQRALYEFAPLVFGDESQRD